MTIEKEAREIVERTKNRSRWDMENQTYVPETFPWLEKDIAKALQKKQDRIEELEFIINSDVPFGTMLINAQTKVKEIEQESKSRMDKIVYAKAELRRCYDKINELESALKDLVTAVTFKNATQINGVDVYEARVPIEFVDLAKKALCL